MSKDKYSITISNYIKKSNVNQALPEDFIEIGDLRNLFKKRLSEEVSNSFSRLNKIKKADLIKNCGTWQYFAQCKNHPKEKHLIRASFCKERLCPMCQYRRGLKIKKCLLDIVTYMKKDNNYKSSKFLFLTLTIKNCPGEELGETIDKMYSALNVMTKKEEVFKTHMKNGRTIKPLVLGMVKTLEITYSKRNNNFHPHIHILMNVKSGYFNGKNYISQKEFVKLWQKYCDLKYEPIVDIRVVRDKKTGEKNAESAIKETGKYAVKDTDIVILRNNGTINEALTDYVIKIYDEVLKSRKMIIFTGSFLKVKQFLFKSDDLDNIETDNTIESEEALIKHYCKICGAQMTEKIASYNFGYRTYQDITNPKTLEMARQEVLNSRKKAKERIESNKNKAKHDAEEFKKDFKDAAAPIHNNHKDITLVNRESKQDKLNKKLIALGIKPKVDCSSCAIKYGCTYYINNINMTICANYKKS